MNNAKIEFSVGGVSFSGEGEEAWLASQLDKIIDKAPDLIKLAPLLKTALGGVETVGSKEVGQQDAAIASQTLPNFIKEKNTSKNQLTRFVATAVWLHAKGKARLSTADVTKALKDSNQSRLGNPSDVLAKNVGKGFCEKDGKDFFVTEEGKASL